jgi:hypothetical protein
MEGQQLDLDAGRKAADEAIERAGDAADAEWWQAAVSAVVFCAHRSGTFTTDDVWVMIPAEFQTREPRALGAVMRNLQDQGVISPTGEYRPTQRPKAHGRPVRVWRGRLP